MYEEHKVAFIFDWNKRHDEFSIYRITKELVSDEPKKIPRYLAYLGACEIKTNCWGYGHDELKKMKSGRYHWRGTIHFSTDYWGEFDEQWEPDSITRIK